MNNVSPLAGSPKLCPLKKKKNYNEKDTINFLRAKQVTWSFYLGKVTNQKNISDHP
jgi:hypothetical protein